MYDICNIYYIYLSISTLLRFAVYCGQSRKSHAIEMVTHCSSFATCIYYIYMNIDYFCEWVRAVSDRNLLALNISVRVSARKSMSHIHKSTKTFTQVVLVFNNSCGRAECRQGHGTLHCACCVYCSAMFASALCVAPRHVIVLRFARVTR